MSALESLDDVNCSLALMRNSNAPSLSIRRTHTTQRDSLKGGEGSIFMLHGKEKENFSASLYEGISNEGQKNLADSKRRMIKKAQDDLRHALQDLESV